MEKNKIIILLIIIFLILSILIILFTPQSMTPNGKRTEGGENIFDKSWDYCKKFSQSECNSKTFFDTNYSLDKINCFWNVKTNNCDASIGLQ